LMTGVKS